MCGIAGFVGPRNSELLHRMCSSLYHRGPDDEGFFESESASLSMRRLAIIDLKTGHQPICNETEDVWVVFNGEIYNYEGLREELRRLGHVFRTESDTETIVHAYEEFGLDFAKHLRGMFGIAIWDCRSNKLILARDRIGEKPLFYAETPGGLLFGSEMKAILCGLPTRSVDHQAVCDYLGAGYVTAPRTFFREIRKIAPGEVAVFESARLSLKRFWDAPRSVESGISFAAACDDLDETLNDAVKACLKSDVEVAAFLSGGIDSSLIVALMKKHEANVQTFSVGYRGAASGFNELEYAQSVSEHVGTHHHELILGAQSNIQLLPKIIFHYDEPHGEPTSMLVYLLCEFVRNRVKVALGGTGGDEFFFGYPRHGGLRYLQLYQLMPKWVRKQAVERVAAMLPESTRGGNLVKRARRFIDGSSLPPDEAYRSWVRLLSSELQSQLLSEDVVAGVDDPAGDEFVRQCLSFDGTGSILDRVATLDVTGYLPEYQLAYMDRMSMANSLEVRAPLCDYRLAEYALRLPNQYRLKGSRSKHILKEVAKRYLPKAIVERKKVGFDSPIGQWFKDELNPFIRSFLAPSQVERTGLLNPETVSKMVNEHCAGNRNYSLQLWSIVSLEAWYRMYIEDQVSSIGNYKLENIRGAPR